MDKIIKWVESRNTVCIDLNGVLDTYQGYTGTSYPPREGACEFLQNLKKLGFTVVILTSIYHSVARHWLQFHGLYQYVDNVVNNKVPAIVYLDDRGITFTGDYNDALQKIWKFRAWWEDSEHIETPIRNGSYESKFS
jgi:cation transport ATPase